MKNWRLFFTVMFSFFILQASSQHKRQTATFSVAYLSSIDSDVVQKEEEEEEDEDPFKGLTIGLNIGSYFASGKTGNFYNGSCAAEFLNNPNDVRCYTIPERLTLTPQDVTSITSYYNASGGFSVPYDSYPQAMRYNPSFIVGMQIKYNFNRNNAIIFNANAMKLKAVSQFTLQFYGTASQTNAQNDIRLFQITGNEQRFNFNWGYRMGSEVSEMVNWYFQPGASMLGTKVEKNQIFVANRTYDLFIGAANPNQVIAYQPRTDIGFGFYLATGFEFFIKQGYTFDISFGFSRDKVVQITAESKVWNKWIQASFTL